MSSFKWKILSQKVDYENPFMRVLKYDVVRSNGLRKPYYVLDRKTDFSIIIPLEENNTTYLVGQYRFPVDYFSWEFPMGAVVGKTPLQMAKQELKEETGLTAKTWKLLGWFHAANGHTNQKGFVFLARDLKEGEPHPEEGEIVTSKKVSLKKVGSLIKKGVIKDAQTIAAYHLLISKYPDLTS